MKNIFLLTLFLLFAYASNAQGNIDNEYQVLVAKNVPVYLDRQYQPKKGQLCALLFVTNAKSEITDIKLSLSLDSVERKFALKGINEIDRHALKKFHPGADKVVVPVFYFNMARSKDLGEFEANAQENLFRFEGESRNGPWKITSPVIFYYDTDRVGIPELVPKPEPRIKHIPLNINLKK